MVDTVVRKREIEAENSLLLLPQSRHDLCVLAHRDRNTVQQRDERKTVEILLAHNS